MEEKKFGESGKGFAVLLLVFYQIVLKAGEPHFAGIIGTEIVSVGFTILSLVMGYEWGFQKGKRDYWLGICRIYLNYWVLYVVFSYLVLAWQKNIYKGSIKNILADAAGLSGLFGTPSISATGWYVSVIVLGWCISPLARKMVPYLKFSLLTGAMMGIILVSHYVQKQGCERVVYYLLVLLLGMCFSEIRPGIRVKNWINWRKWGTLAWFAVLVCVTGYLRENLGIVMEVPLGCCFLACLYCLWACVPQIGEWFIYLGKNWFLIFLIVGFMMECGYSAQLRSEYDSTVVMTGALLSGAVAITILVTKWKEKLR